MAINVVWDDDLQTILRWDFEQDWTWEDFHAAFDQSVKIAGSKKERVDVIPYLAQSKLVPPNTLMQFNRVSRLSPPNTNLIVITGGTTLVNAMISMFRSVYRVNTWRTAATLEDARAIITQDRARSG